MKVWETQELSDGTTLRKVPGGWMVSDFNGSIYVPDVNWTDGMLGLEALEDVDEEETT